MDTNRIAHLKSKILEQSSQCVKCGKCLSSCPTYNHYHNEARSPRGRISLMRALAEDSIPASEKLKGHLESCLHCLACESSCPSQVSYGESMNFTKELWQAKSKHNQLFSKIPLALKALIKYPLLIPHLRLGLYIYKNSPISYIANKVLGETKLGNMEKLLPEILPPVNLQKISKNFQSQNKVQLFLGCISQVTDQKTSKDSIDLLNTFGFEVLIPKKQSCCGTVYLHAGNKSKSDNYIENNTIAFNKEYPIVYSASGCKPVLSSPHGEAKEICGFLAEQKALPEFQRSSAKILLHTPCTLRQNSKASNSAKALLSLIPGITIQELQSKSCCGASGLNMVQNPSLADNIVESLLKDENITNFDILLTSNIGCFMHINKHLKKTGKKVKVMHPVSFLAKLAIDKKTK